jgi:putative transcriptional regulator
MPRATGGKAAGKARPKAAAPDGSAPTFGETVLSRLRAVNATLQAGGMGAVRTKYTVRRVRVAGFPRPALAAADVAAIRAGLGVSQAVFAALLGVAPNTVRAWEQGVNPVPGIAARFLAEIRRDPAYWQARIDEATDRS